METLKLEHWKNLEVGKIYDVVSQRCDFETRIFT